MKDNFFGNSDFLKSFSKRLKEQERNLKPLYLAAKQLEHSGIAKYANLMTSTFTQQIEAVGEAYLSRTYQFDSLLIPELRNIYGSLGQVYDNIATIETMMKTQFQELVQPSLYLPNSSTLFASVNSSASTISDKISKIDTSWMKCVNPWQTKVSYFVSYDSSVLKGVDTEFAKLIKMEQETSGLIPIVNHFSEITSVTAQLASIEKLFSGMAEQWRAVIAPFQFLDGYSHFALRQHELIQKAASVNDDKSVEWRLDLLGATSKFVDRQITWANDLAVEIQTDIQEEKLPFPERELDINVIPQYIGYSKRDNTIVDKALMDAVITVVTEKGKLIVHKALLIQKLCKVNNRELLFENTESYISSYMILGGTFCKNSNSLKTIVEALYHLFYEQQETISMFVDLKNFDCIKQIKDMKNEDCYLERPKEISNLQSTLYDQFLKIEDTIIGKLEADIVSCQPTTSITKIIAEDSYTEETINKYVFKALCRIQSNKIYWGKKEDELNDGIRDFLSMIYEIKDQTRQGISPNGKDAGEVDLQICKDGFPVAMIEGLKVSSVNRSYIRDHINKILIDYDPLGCPYVYVIIYVTAKKFAEFWEKYLNYIKVEYNFPFPLKEEVHEENCIYTNLKYAKAIIIRSNKEVIIHFFALRYNE